MTTNASGLEPRPAENLVERVAAVAASRPDAVAVTAGGARLTWSGLEARSNAAGRRLHEQFGAGPEPIVIVGAGGLDGTVALLGALKSGRPFTWVEAGGPTAHIRQVISLARPEAVLAGSRAEGLDVPGSIPLSSLCHGEEGSGPAVRIRRTDPATIVFTSGSTGVPKGVVASHGFHLANVQTLTLRGFSSADHVAVVLSLAFAYGVNAFLRTLGMGAVAHLYDLSAEHGISSLASWVQREQVDVLEMTPPLLRSLVRTLGDGVVLDHVRIVELGGEALHARDVAEFRSHLPAGCEVRNIYGSSETGWSTAYAVSATLETVTGTMPVGTAVPGKEVALRGPDGSPVPIGEVGEIFVSARDLASAYWQQPELTAARFSLSGDGRTTYRTGDLGRFLPDGNLVHLGRVDRMLKVRGYLVEPAQVEAALRDTGLVREAAAVGQYDEDGHGSVLAYVVPANGAAVSPGAIRRSLRQRVPEYLVPSRVVCMSSLPRNGNDKTDLSALLAAAPSSAAPVAPLTDWERAVAGVWCAVLGVDEAGAEDDFFASGGDSLAVEELIAAMAAELGVTLRAADVTACPTLAALAERARAPRPRQSVLVPLQPAGTAAPLFCFAGAGAPAGAFLLTARHLGADRPVYGIQARGLEGDGLPDWSVRRWAARAVKAIRAAQPTGPYHLAGHSLGGMLAWEAAHQLRAAGEDVGLLAVIDTLVLAVDGRRRSPARVVAGTVKRFGTELGEATRISLAGIRPGERSRQTALFFRHGQLLAERYRPRPWDGPTILFRAAEGPPAPFAPYDWTPLLRGSWEELSLPGDHNTTLAEPNVAVLAAHLRTRLADPRSIGGGRSPTGRS